MASIDCFVVPTVRFKIFYVLIVLAHDRRRIVHFNVTEHPTAQWPAQQLVEAFPFDGAPWFLLCDGDSIYGVAVRRKIKSLGIEEVVMAPASPWQNPYAEPVIGSIRRELLDHAVVLSERHLRRLLSCYVACYHESRLHRSLDMDAPAFRSARPTLPDKLVEFSAALGLHHYYVPLVA